MADSNKLPDNDEIIELTEIIEKGAVPSDSDFLKSLGLDKDDLAEKNSVSGAAASTESSPAHNDDLFADLDSADNLSLSSMPDLDSIIGDLDASPAASAAPKAEPGNDAEDPLAGLFDEPAAAAPASSPDTAITDTGISDDDLLADLFATPSGAGSPAQDQMPEQTPPAANADDILDDLFATPQTDSPSGAASTTGLADQVPLDALDLNLDGTPDDDTDSLPGLTLIGRDNPVEDPNAELRDMSEDALFSEIIKQAKAKPEAPVKRKPSPPRSSLANRRDNDLSLFGGNQTVQTTIDEISGQSASQAASVQVSRDDNLLDDLLNMPTPPQEAPELSSLETFGAEELESMDSFTPAPQSPKDLFVRNADAAAPSGGLDDSDLFADLLDAKTPQQSAAASQSAKSLEDDLFGDLSPSDSKSEESDLFAELETAAPAAPSISKDIPDALDNAEADLAEPDPADIATAPYMAESGDAKLSTAAPAAPAMNLESLLDLERRAVPDVNPLADPADLPDNLPDSLDAAPDAMLSDSPDDAQGLAFEGSVPGMPEASELVDDVPGDLSGDVSGDVLDEPMEDLTVEPANELPGQLDEIESLDLGELDNAVAELEEEIAHPHSTELNADAINNAAETAVDNETRPRFDTPDVGADEDLAAADSQGLDQEQPMEVHDAETSELDALLDDVIAAAPPISKAGLFSDSEKADQASGAGDDFSIQNLSSMLLGRMDKLESAIRLHSQQPPQSAARDSSDSIDQVSTDQVQEALREGSPLFEQLLASLESRMQRQSLPPALLEDLQDMLTMQVQEQVMETLDSRIEELVSAKLAKFAADRDAGLEQVSSYVKESLMQDMERSAAAAAAKVIKEEVLALFAEEK